MNKATQEKINKLSNLEQSTHYLSTQRQSFQNQMYEIESATEELSDDRETYKILGNLMIKADPKKLKEELLEKKNIISVRISSIQKQEDKIKEESKKLQEEVMKELEKAEKEGDRK